MAHQIPLKAEVLRWRVDQQYATENKTNKPTYFQLLELHDEEVLPLRRQRNSCKAEREIFVASSRMVPG